MWLLQRSIAGKGFRTALRFYSSREDKIDRERCVAGWSSTRWRDKQHHQPQACQRLADSSLTFANTLHVERPIDVRQCVMFFANEAGESMYEYLHDL
jgi:hypothetical protein